LIKTFGICFWRVSARLARASASGFWGIGGIGISHKNVGFLINHREHGGREE
jgi:hypothetical protein